MIHGTDISRRAAVGALLVVLAATVALYSWNLSASGLSDYYATAAKSMSVSWRAFFFGSFDAQSTITIDKLVGFLVPQALSARLFGFSEASLALPQVIEGLVTVAATFLIVRRFTTRLLGLVGAVIVATTPLLVSVFSHSMEDGLLTMSITLAVLAWQRAVQTEKHRWLLVAGLLVGLAFQAKMLQAWIVLPPLAVVYLLVVERTLAFRLRGLALAAAATLVGSLGWMTAIALVPAGQRPYIDGTTNNNIFSMVFAYNGLNRFVPGLLPGALTPEVALGGASSVAIPPEASPPGAAIIRVLAGHTPLKFLLAENATQIGWLYPLAAAGLVLGLLALRGRYGSGSLLDARETGLRTMLLLATALLVCVGGVLSVMTLPHMAYLAALALPLTLLCVVGIVMLVRADRMSPSSIRFALPVTLGAQTVWSTALVAHYPSFSGALVVPVALAGTGCTIVAAYLVRAPGPERGGALLGAIWRSAGVVAVLVAAAGPLVWSISTVVPAFSGSANDANAGPAPTTLADTVQAQNVLYGIGLNSNRHSSTTAGLEESIYDYAQANSGSRPYVLATDTWRSAAPLVLTGDAQVLPIGGYTARVASPFLGQIVALVARGDLRFVLVTGPTSKSGLTTPSVTAVQHWAQATCRVVPRSAYGAAELSPFRVSTDELYDCR